LNACATGGYQSAVDSARIIYTPRPDITPESEATALAAVYKFVLDCRAKKKGRPTTSGPDDAERESKHHDFRATNKCSK
jgi:hypothetical protein